MSETVPVTVLKERLAQKDRVYQKKIEELEKKLQAQPVQQSTEEIPMNENAQMQPAENGQPLSTAAPDNSPSPLSAVVAENVAETPKASPDAKAMATELAVANASGVPASIPLTDIPKLVSAIAQYSQQQMMEQKAQTENDAIEQAKNDVMKSVINTAENDKDLDAAIRKNVDITKSAFYFLVGQDDPELVLKKLLSSPEQINEYKNGTAVQKTNIINRMARLVQAEKIGDMTPQPASKFATSQGQGAIQKSLESMTTAEMREYYAKKGMYNPRRGR